MVEIIYICINCGKEYTLDEMDSTEDPTTGALNMACVCAFEGDDEKTTQWRIELR